MKIRDFQHIWLCLKTLVPGWYPKVVPLWSLWMLISRAVPGKSPRIQDLADSRHGAVTRHSPIPSGHLSTKSNFTRPNASGEDQIPVAEPLKTQIHRNTMKYQFLMGINGMIHSINGPTY